MVTTALGLEVFVVEFEKLEAVPFLVELEELEAVPFLVELVVPLKEVEFIVEEEETAEALEEELAAAA